MVSSTGLLLSKTVFTLGESLLEDSPDSAGRVSTGVELFLFGIVHGVWRNMQSLPRSCSSLLETPLVVLVESPFVVSSEETTSLRLFSLGD